MIVSTVKIIRIFNINKVWSQNNIWCTSKTPESKTETSRVTRFRSMSVCVFCVTLVGHAMNICISLIPYRIVQKVDHCWFILFCRHETSAFFGKKTSCYVRLYFRINKIATWYTPPFLFCPSIRAVSIYFKHHLIQAILVFLHNQWFRASISQFL